MHDEIIPRSVLEAESGAYDWLKSRGFIVPCPFERRLDQQERSQCLTLLVKRQGFRYRDATLGNYEVYHEKQKDVLRRLGAFVKDMPDLIKGGGGLLLFGDPGTGKDHLLAAVMKLAIMHHGLEVCWFDGGDLFDRFHMALRDDTDREWVKLSAGLRKPHILAISDPQPPLGELSQQQVRRLRDIIERRYREGTSTWMTTNIDNRDYAERLFTRPVMERMKESAGMILCEWPSYRERRKAKW